MEVTKITLEDKGQDFLHLFVSEKGEVLEAKPFQTSIWAGATIPIWDENMVKIGEPCPIHNPPYIMFGFLKYNIEKIEKIDYEHHNQ